MKSTSKKEIVTTKKEIVTTTESTYEFDHHDILKALIECGSLPIGKVTTDTQIYMEVPGGGDWSNTKLDMKDGYSLFVKIKEIKFDNNESSNDDE